LRFATPQFDIGRNIDWRIRWHNGERLMAAGG
jgi:hypothetical protein